MCATERHWHLAPGDYDAAGRARAEFRHELRSCAARGSDFDGAEIIFGELVTNALRHSTGDADVRFFCTERRLHLEIRNRGEAFDLATAAGVERRDGEGGRGLMIAQRLGADLRVAAAGDCCVVRASLPVRCEPER